MAASSVAGTYSSSASVRDGYTFASGAQTDRARADAAGCQRRTQRTRATRTSATTAPCPIPHRRHPATTVANKHRATAPVMTQSVDARSNPSNPPVQRADSDAAHQSDVDSDMAGRHRWNRAPGLLRHCRQSRVHPIERSICAPGTGSAEHDDVAQYVALYANASAYPNASSSRRSPAVGCPRRSNAPRADDA